MCSSASHSLHSTQACLSGGAVQSARGLDDVQMGMLTGVNAAMRTGGGMVSLVNGWMAASTLRLASHSSSSDTACEQASTRRVTERYVSYAPVGSRGTQHGPGFPSTCVSVCFSKTFHTVFLSYGEVG